MEKGQIVKFKEPVDDDETIERFKVLEDRKERVLVESLIGFDKWHINPTFVYDVADLEIV